MSEEKSNDTLWFSTTDEEYDHQVMNDDGNPYNDNTNSNTNINNDNDNNNNNIENNERQEEDEAFYSAAPFTSNIIDINNDTSNINNNNDDQGTIVDSGTCSDATATAPSSSSSPNEQVGQTKNDYYEKNIYTQQVNNEMVNMINYKHQMLGHPNEQQQQQHRHQQQDDQYQQDQQQQQPQQSAATQTSNSNVEELAAWQRQHKYFEAAGSTEETIIVHAYPVNDDSNNTHTPIHSVTISSLPPLTNHNTNDTEYIEATVHENVNNNLSTNTIAVNTNSDNNNNSCDMEENRTVRTISDFANAGGGSPTNNDNNNNNDNTNDSEYIEATVQENGNNNPVTNTIAISTSSDNNNNNSCDMEENGTVTTISDCANAGGGSPTNKDNNSGDQPTITAAVQVNLRRRKIIRFISIVCAVSAIAVLIIIVLNKGGDGPNDDGSSTRDLPFPEDNTYDKESAYAFVWGYTTLTRIDSTINNNSSSSTSTIDPLFCNSSNVNHDNDDFLMNQIILELKCGGGLIQLNHASSNVLCVNVTGTILNCNFSDNNNNINRSSSNNYDTNTSTMMASSSSMILFSCLGETINDRLATAIVSDRNDCMNTPADNNGSTTRNEMTNLKASAASYASLGRFCKSADTSNNTEWSLWSSSSNCEGGDRMVVTNDGTEYKSIFPKFPNATEIEDLLNKVSGIFNGLFGSKNASTSVGQNDADDGNNLLRRQRGLFFQSIIDRLPDAEAKLMEMLLNYQSYCYSTVSTAPEGNSESAVGTTSPTPCNNHSFRCAAINKVPRVILGMISGSQSTCHFSPTDKGPSVEDQRQMAIEEFTVHEFVKLLDD